MSHFLVGVIVPPDTDDVEDAVENLLSQYDENEEVESYDTECWACHGTLVVTEPCGTCHGAGFVGGIDNNGVSTQQECPECKGARQVSHPCDECHLTGVIESTYNPNSKWDWWIVGGRWDGLVSAKGQRRPSSDGGFNFEPGHNSPYRNSCLVKQLKPENIPFALVTPDSVWHEKGNMGWWGVVSNENADWNEVAHAILAAYPDHLIVGVDCHI